jgi:hypothetical protein
VTAAQFAEKLAYATIPLFWPVFLATATLIVFAGVRAPLPWRSREPFRAAPILAVTACLAPYLALLLWGAEFTYYDNDVFTESIAAGHWRAIGIWPQQGRYFPLFVQEFNALSLAGSSPLLFHGFVAAQLVALCWLLTAALAEAPPAWRYGAIATLVLSNSVGFVFADLLAAERNVVFWLAAVIVALQRLDREPSRLTVIGGGLAALAAVNYQEPVFLTIAAVAITRLALVSKRGPGASPGQLLWSVDAGLLCICLIFAAQMAASRLAFQPGPSIDRVNFGFLTTLAQHLRNDFLLLPFAAAVVSRIARLRRLGEIDPIWDPLALGAMAYFGSLLVMGLPGTRHAAPFDLIAVLVATREAMHRTRTATTGRAILPVLSSVVAALVILAGGFRLLEHRSVVLGTARLADAVERYTATHEGTVRLYFPAARDWRIMNVAAYFHHRGGNLATRVEMAAPHRFPEGRCVGYVPYRCVEAMMPKSGNIVVRLADDTTRVLEPQGEPLLDFELLPGGIPPLLRDLAYRQSELYLLAHRQLDDEMPEGWLSTRAWQQR